MAKQILLEVKVNSEFNKLQKLERELRELRALKKATAKEDDAQNAKLKTQISALSGEYNKQKKVVIAVEKSKRGLLSQYEKESAELNRLRKRLKDVLLVEGRTTKETDRLAKRVQRLDSRLKKVDGAAGQFQRNVGNYQSGFKGLASNIGGAALAATGMVGGAQLIFSAVGDAITKVREFEQGNANLAAVLGKTKAEIVGLTEDAKKFGSITSFSASQVTELQTELAKLGFDEGQIKDATGGILDLAAATGTDLATAAEVAGATLGGFGLDADQTARISDVMAKSFSTSALDMTKFQESMKSAAPAARAVGVSAEETTALLGVLANAGISGSKAGNNLKTSFINLNAAGLSLDEGLEQVANSQDKLGTATKLVGKNAAASFLVLAEGREDVARLTKEYDNAEGAAAAMAATQLDTLDGALKILSSSWEGLILSISDGSGVMGGIVKNVIQDLSGALGVLSGNVDAAGDRFNWFALSITSLKVQWSLMIGVIKLLFVPLRLAFTLFTKLGQKMGILSKGTTDWGQVILKVQNVILRLPEIIDVVIDGIITSFLGLSQVVVNVGKLMAKAFNPIQLAKDIAAGKNPLSTAFADIGNAATAAFKKGVGGIGEEIRKIFAKGPSEDAKRAAKQLGEKVGDSLAKEVGSKKTANKLKLAIRQAWEAATQEPLVIKSKARLEFESLDAPKAAIQGGTTEELQKFRQKDKELAIAAAQETADAIFEVEKANQARKKQFELDQLAIRTDFETDNLKAKLDSGLISQAEFENNRIALEQQTQDKRREIEKDAFQKKKRLDTAQALINGALAITKILAATGPASPPLIAAAIATTAIQVGTIQAQKFAKGGMIRGASHAQGGVPIMGGRAEVEGGEAIINKRSSAMFAPLLSTLNQLGGGVAFARGGITPMFANGGTIGSLSGGTDLSGLGREIAREIGDLRVINVATETASVNNRIVNIETDVSL